MSSKKYFPGLELPRFLMSIAIIVFHYRLVFLASPGIRYSAIAFLYKYGAYSVQVFFMISGFLLYWNYNQKLRPSSPADGVSSSDSKVKEISFVSFLQNRIIRIYPYMILTSVAAAVCIWLTIALFPEGHLVIAGWATDDLQPTLVAFVLSVLGVQCGWLNAGDQAAINGPTWYLAILMVCNVIFYLILKCCKGDKTKENCVFFVLALFGTSLWYGGDIAFPLLRSNNGRGYMNFFIGVLLAQIMQKIDSEKKRYNMLAISIGSIILYGLLAQLGCLGNTLLASSMVLFPALLLIFTTSRVITSISDNKIISYLGKLSFGIYLWNLPIVMWFYFVQDALKLEIDYNNKWFFLLTILITIVVSVIVHELFEKPATTWCIKWFASADK